MDASSRVNGFPSRSSLGYRFLVFIRRRVRKVILRRRSRRVTLRTRAVSIDVISIPGSSGVLIVSPLVVGLVRLMVVVSVVAAEWVVVSGIIIPAIPLVELVTVLLLLLWGSSVAVPGVWVVVLRVLLVSHCGQGLGRVESEGEETGGKGKGVGWKDCCSRQLRFPVSSVIGVAMGGSEITVTACRSNTWAVHQPSTPVDQKPSFLFFSGYGCITDSRVMVFVV